MSHKQANNGDAEVFVLPPNLLEKLGINLCNIIPNEQQFHEPKKRKNKDHLTDASYSNHEGILNNVSKTVKYTEHSSILETANLMKNSLFLSPTFIPIAAEIHPDDVEIANNVEQYDHLDNCPDVNATIITKDNSFDKHLNQENGLEQKKIHERVTSVEISNNQNYSQKSENGKIKEYNVLSDIQNSNLNDIELGSQFECKIPDDAHRLNLKNNLQSTEKLQKDSKSKIMRLANGNDLNCANRNDNKQDKVSLMPIPTFNNIQSTIQSENAIIIPILDSEITKSFNFRGTDTTEVSIEQEQLSLIPLPTEREAEEIAYIVDNVNIIEYTEYCDDSANMELDTILDETEILTPILCNTESVNTDENMDNTINHSNNIDLCHVNGLCDNVVENEVLMDVPTDLINISNLSQNLSDTQDINIDILYETFDENNISDEIETANINQQQKLTVPKSVESETSLVLHTNRNSNDIEYDETSDMELDEILRETEILVSLPLLSPKSQPRNDIINNEKGHSYTKLELRIENEVDSVLKVNGVESISEFTNEESDHGSIMSLYGKVDADNIVMYAHNSITNGDSLQIIQDEVHKVKHGSNCSNVHMSQISSQDKSIVPYDCHSDFNPSERQIEKNDTFETNGENTLKDMSQYVDKDVIKESPRLNHGVTNIYKLGTDIVENNNIIYGDEVNKHKIEDVDIFDVEKNTSVTKNKLGKTKIIKNQEPAPNQINIEQQKSCLTIDRSFSNSKETVDNLRATCNSSLGEKEEEKIQEIASYLKQALQNNCKQNNRKDGVKILKPKPGNLAKSKKFIHGVEKPGGSDDQDLILDKAKILKTYERKKKSDTLHVTPINSFVGVAKPEENCTEIDLRISPAFVPKRREYCLCDDFGTLSHVEDDNDSYEHIHFGSSKSVNCPVNTVFEIYNEISIVTNMEDKEYTEEDTYEYGSIGICWQTFEYEKDKQNCPDMQLVVEINDETNLELNVSKTPSSQEESVCISESEIIEVQDNEASVDNEDSNETNDNSFLKPIFEVYYDIQKGCCTDILVPQKDTESEDNDKVMDMNDTIESSKHTKQNKVVKTVKKKSDIGPDINKDAMDSRTDEVLEAGSTLTSKERKIEEVIEGPSEPSKEEIKCAVCELVFPESEWERHISKAHTYIAWKEGENMDFDNLLLLKNLKKTLLAKGSLICTFCGFEYVKLNRFLSHVKKCVKQFSNPETDESSAEKVAATSEPSIKCGVCLTEVRNANWMQHISQEHQYLAWKDGDPPLETGDENKVISHLLEMGKQYGPLICAKCGLLRTYSPKSIKSYISHIKKCSKKNTEKLRTSTRKKAESSPPPSIYKCAVCDEEMVATKWFDHIFEKHNYRAWKVGENAPDFEDEAALKEYLQEISNQDRGLRCSKCGVVRKYVKSYLQHVRSCKDPKETNVKEKDEIKTKKQNTVTRTTEEPKSDILNTTDCQISQLESDVSAISNTVTPKTSKRKLPAPITTSSPKIAKKTLPKGGMTTCGVCDAKVDESSWMDHIGKEHDYIAWRVGETPLNPDDTESLWAHFHNVVSITGKLVCAKCGLERKYPKVFLQHTKNCRGPPVSSNNSMNESYIVNTQVQRYLTSKNLDPTMNELKCGACGQGVPREGWVAHTQAAHNYVAWIDGDKVLDLNNEDMILEHLRQMVDELGSLACAKCGTTRKYAKKFLQHVQQCSEQKNPKKDKNTSSVQIKTDELVSCGVCRQGIRINQWISHIQMTHNYIAFKSTQTSFNVQNGVKVENRLRVLCHRIRELTCPKCGYASDDVKLYMEHSDTCTGNSAYDPADTEVTRLAQKGLYKCGVCQKNVKYGKWKSHAIDEHYNVTWAMGDEPIDLHNQHEITKIMKEYLQYGTYVCKACGMARTSGIGFFAHFITCGTSEEEQAKYKSSCEICGTQYLSIYRSQHMAVHTQQQAAKERRGKLEEGRERERERMIHELSAVSGRRRAAEKARMVIEETVTHFKHVCQSCQFATDAQDEFDAHKCNKRRRQSDELDLSLEKEESSDDEPAEGELSEGGEDDDDDDKSEWSKRNEDNISHRAKITRIPFLVSNVPDFIAKNIEDETEHYLTTDTLFPQWTTCDYHEVPNEELAEYMPPLEQSCKVHANEKWSTYKRFEAVVNKDKTTIFAGASVVRLSWLPAGRGSAPPVLAVSAEAAREHGAAHLSQHAALIQLWDFGIFDRTPPKLSLGLALRCGTVRAMDWCPSGAQESPDGPRGFVRMGLLAVACSDGMGYILSVPYPSSVVTSDSVIYKFEPVAQLRFTMKTDRTKYQATSICWSMQKGHATIIVGYADGSTAFYDLNTESPFLKCRENNMTIYYPYSDERIHNGCITDVTAYPLAWDSSGGACVGTASIAGGAFCAGGGGGAGGGRREGRFRSHLAASRAMFMPAWPSLMLAGEDVYKMMSTNELEFWGCGRRVGLATTCCACAHCAHVAYYMPPFVRLVQPHQARCGVKKRAIAWLGLQQLGKKRKNPDEKEVTLEPFTYEDAVKKYGIKFKLMSKATTKEEHKKSISHYKEINPERFPLAEVSSMAYCPSATYHKRLAVGTRAGLIFILET